MTVSRCLALCALGALLAGCTTAPDAQANAEGVPPGYRYHDGTHSSWVASPSPQALYNASHGVWLWPPMENGKPG